MAFPQAILVDLDDTILDDSGSVEDGWRVACRDAARQAGLDAEALFIAIMGIREWFWADPARHQEGRMDLKAASLGIVQRALLSLGLDRPALAAEMADAYRDFRDAAIRPFPGAIEALESLRHDGVRLALLTNGSGPAQRAKIERFGLASYFDSILIEGEFGVGKPDPRVYASAMKALGTRPDQTWSVGDNLEWDVGGPQRLGVYGIWVDYARIGLMAKAEVRPDRIVHALREIVT